MELRRLIPTAVLTLPVLLFATQAFADPDRPAAQSTKPAAGSSSDNGDPTMVSGGFSLVHYYGGNYVGAFGTFAQRITTGEHPIAVVGMVSFHSAFGEHPITFMGGAEGAIKRTDDYCVSGRGLVGITHWDGSNDLTFQVSGVFEYHLKQMKGLSIEVEGGFLINHASGNSGHGLVINAGISKTF